MSGLIRSNRSRGFLKQLLIGIFVIGLAVITASAQAKPFLSAKGNDQRCKSLLEWLDIMEEISGGFEFLVWDDLVDVVSPAFADDIFIPAIGKSYSALSNSEKKRIGKYLKKCERKPYEFGFLTAPFAKKRKVHPRSAEYWKQGISRAKNGLDALNKKRAQVARAKAAAEDRERVKTIRATTKKERLPHYAGRILTETPDLRIHEFRFDTHDVDTKCAPYSLSSDYMNVSLVLKNLDFRVTEQSMAAIFRNTLVPLQQSECPQATQINARIFFDGVHLGSAANDLSELDIKRGYSRGINETCFATARLGTSTYSSGNISIDYFRGRSGLLV